MFKHHTKDKGDLGVLKVKLDVHQQGYMILNPETEHAPFDLVIYKDSVFKTVQVKYRALSRNGTLQIPFRSNYSYSKGTVSKSIDKSKIDVFAVYCPETDMCYYFDPGLFGESVTLRVNTPLNNQSAYVHKAEDFRKVP
jgi:hypothetical protein